MIRQFCCLALLFAPLLAVADAPDPAVYQKQIDELEKQQRREVQKVDQAEEQERIKLRARERDEMAKIQRDVSTATATATAGYVATGSTGAYDPVKFGQLKFAEDEVHNLIQNQLSPEISIRFERDRKAVERKYALARAKLDAQQTDVSDDDGKQKRDLALKMADLNDKYQLKYDDLALEQSGEEAKARYSHTTKINAGERDMAVMVNKHAFDQSGKTPAGPWNPMADPEYTKLTAVRDQARSDLDTEIDEIHAKFNARKTDIDNAKEDDAGKLNGG